MEGREMKTVVVGVTGHRILTDEARIVAGVDLALRRIQEAFGPDELTILSPLAEGADQLVAQCALARHGARLVVPLPLPMREYLRDMSTLESFRQLCEEADTAFELPAQATRTSAYEAVGRYVVAHCDVLLAIWDGRRAQGEGGTSEVVAWARAEGKPLAWVRAGNRRPGTMKPTTLGAEQGKVTFERFPTAQENI
jgi:hypothetical protein